MITINNYEVYEGGEISPHVLYLSGSEDIQVIGKVDFNVFGDVRMNGVPISSCHMRINLREPTSFQVQKDSAIMFSQAPLKAKDVGKPVEVPDVPDMADMAERQMFAMFESWAAQRGMKKPDEYIEDDDEEDEINYDDDYDMDFPLDNEDDRVIYSEKWKEQDGVVEKYTDNTTTVEGKEVLQDTMEGEQPVEDIPLLEQDTPEGGLPALDAK